MKDYYNRIIFVFSLLICMSCATNSIAINIPAHEYVAEEVAVKYERSMELIRSALIFLEEKKYKQAIEKLLLAKEITPVPLCSYALGFAYKMKGDYTNSLLHFDEALRLYHSGVWEIDRALLDKLIYHTNEARAVILRQKLSEKSNETISISIE